MHTIIFHEILSYFVNVNANVSVKTVIAKLLTFHLIQLGSRCQCFRDCLQLDPYCPPFIGISCKLQLQQRKYIAASGFAAIYFIWLQRRVDDQLDGVITLLLIYIPTMGLLSRLVDQLADKPNRGQPTRGHLLNKHCDLIKKKIVVFGE